MRRNYARAAMYVFACLIVPTANLGAAQYVGFTTASFGNPTPPCDLPVTCTGLGTSAITWGEPASDQGASGVVFTPANFDVEAGVLFTLGTLTLENRPLIGGTFPDYFSLVITYHLSDQVSRQSLRMLQVSTPNVGDRVRDADWISLSPDLAEMAFFVFEDESESVRLLTAFEPALGARGLLASALPPQARLQPIQFGDVLGPNGFVGPIPVPEPGTWLLMSGSLSLLALRMVRIRSRGSKCALVGFRLRKALKA
jgi:hypothetical protein